MDSPVRFRLSLKYAQIVVLIGESSSLEVDSGSVSRNRPATGIVETHEKTTSGYGAGATLGVSPKGILGRIGLSGLKGRFRNKKSKFKENTANIAATHAKSADGHHCWRLTPARHRTLYGPVWDSKKEPRLAVIDNRTKKQRQRDSDRELYPEAIIEVRCKREDIVIEDIKLKNNAADVEWRSRAGSAERLAAAEGYIKECLRNENLDAGDMSEIFSDIVLFNIVVPFSR